MQQLLKFVPNKQLYGDPEFNMWSYGSYSASEIVQACRIFLGADYDVAKFLTLENYLATEYGLVPASQPIVVQVG